MTQRLPKNAMLRVHESLGTHLNNWRSKFGLSAAAAYEIATAHIQQAQKKAAPKRPRQPKPNTVPQRSNMARPQSSDDERIAQEREGRARAAQDKQTAL
jgi:hypothetical protein